MAKTTVNIKIKKVFPPVPPTPTITVSSNSIGFANTKLGSVSLPQVYQVSGANLTAPIIISAAAGYIINIDGTTNNTAPITINPTSGSVAPTTVYVMFAPNNYATFNTVINNSSTGAVTKNVSVTGIGTMEAVLVTWWNSLSIKPAAQTMTAFQKMFKILTDSGNLSKLDVFHFFGGLNDNAQYLKPIVSVVGNFSSSGTLNYNAPGLSFSAGGFLDTGYKPDSSAVNYTANNGSIGLYCYDNQTGAYYDMGSNDATNKVLLKILDSGNLTGIVNHTTGATHANASSKGFFAAKMDGGNNIKLTINGTTYANAVAGTAAASNKTILIGARNNNGTPADHSPRKFVCVFIGGDLDMTAMYNAVLGCATDLGVN